MASETRAAAGDAGRGAWLPVLVAGCLILMISNGARSSWGLFLPEMTQARGWSRETFSFAIALQNLMWGLGGSFLGAMADKYGSMRTLLLGAVLQSVALMLFLPFDGLASLFVISALFGLFQGGIVPSYALVIREYFPASLAATRVGDVLMFTLFGMALGGWMSGKVFDLTGSYQAAFVNGIGWNLVTVTIAATLLVRARRLYGEPMLSAVAARAPG